MRGVLVGLALLGLLPAGAQTDLPGGEVPRVTIDFDQVEVREAMKLLGEQTGISFIVTPDVQGSFSARFINERLDNVLKVIGLSLGAEIQLVEGVFIVRRPKPAAVEPTAAEPPAAAPTEPARTGGAAALLPGVVPDRKIQEAGATAPPLAGTTVEAPVATRPEKVRTTIPIERRTVPEIAGALGIGYIDQNGIYHAPGTFDARTGLALPPAGGGVWSSDNPYENLPPGARVTRNGTILLPNGATVLPSGVVITRDGTIIGRQQPTQIRVPYGTTAGQLQQQLNPQAQQPGGLYGNVDGFGFGLTQNGLTINPPTLNVGGAQIQLPQVNVGGQPTATQPNQPPGVQVYSPTGAPNVHYYTRPQGFQYGLPPDWHFTPPTGGAAFYPGFTQPKSNSNGQ